MEYCARKVQAAACVTYFNRERARGAHSGVKSASNFLADYIQNPPIDFDKPPPQVVDLVSGELTGKYIKSQTIDRNTALAAVGVLDGDKELSTFVTHPLSHGGSWMPEVIQAAALSRRTIGRTLPRNFFLVAFPNHIRSLAAVRSRRRVGTDPYSSVPTYRSRETPAASVGFPNPSAPKVWIQCHVAPPSVVVLMYHVAGSEKGTAQRPGEPLALGLTFARDIIVGWTHRVLVDPLRTVQHLDVLQHFDGCRRVTCLRCTTASTCGR